MIYNPNHPMIQRAVVMAGCGSVSDKWHPSGFHIWTSTVEYLHQGQTVGSTAPSANLQVTPSWVLHTWHTWRTGYHPERPGKALKWAHGNLMHLKTAETDNWKHCTTEEMSNGNYYLEPKVQLNINRVLEEILLCKEKKEKNKRLICKQ